MANALVQTATGGTTSGTSHTVTWGSDTTTGNLFVASIMVGGASSVSSITDSQSNTWTKITSLTGTSTVTLEIWYSKNITGGTTPTITINHSNQQANSIVREFSGLDTASPLDKSAIAAGIGGSPSSGATATTTSANELVVGFAADIVNAGTVGAGYSNLLRQQKAGTTMSAYIEGKTVTSTGTQTATFGGMSSIWVVGVATFKEVVELRGSNAIKLQAVNRAGTY